MLLLFSEINKINMNYFDFRFERYRSKLCTKPNYGNGDLSGIRFSLHENKTWVARLTFILSSCLRLGAASLGTNMILICHQHGKLSRQRQHRRMIGKEYGTKQWIAWLRNSDSHSALALQATDTVPVAHGVGRRTGTDYSQHAAFAQMFFHIG